MCALLKRHKKLVIKRNSGSGGSGVYIVENQGQLEAVTTEIFRTARSLSISPYYDIINEYRTIYCFGEPLLIYKKIRPHVTGDGKHTLSELVASAYNGEMEIADNRLDKAYVPANGEVVTISWKHNLGQGAEAEPIDKDGEIYSQIVALAKKAAECVNVNFASIDIIDTAEGLKILEINSGIMMENFSSYDEENYNIAKSIYKRAIDRYFETH
jgi:glutathione synthase/RimK-type ligase-like ATP-grasp enzyme